MLISSNHVPGYKQKQRSGWDKVSRKENAKKVAWLMSRAYVTLCATCVTSTWLFKGFPTQMRHDRLTGKPWQSWLWQAWWENQFCNEKDRFWFFQEPITRSVHLHCIRDPTYAQTEVFLEMCFPRTSVSTAVRIWPKSTLKQMTAQARSEVPHPSSVFLDYFSLSALEFSHMRTAAETDVRGKQF